VQKLKQFLNDILNFVLFSKYRAFSLIICHDFTNSKQKLHILLNMLKIFHQNHTYFGKFVKIFRQNCISFANFVIKIKHISTEFVKDLLLKCAYFT
jgi:hypothetical protein